MSERARAVLLGLAVAIAPLLLLDLAVTLTDTVRAGETSVWWSAGVHAATGAVVAAGVLLARRDRLAAAVAVVVVLLAVLPTIPDPTLDLLDRVPLLPQLGQNAGFTIGGVIAGAYAYALVRGPRG